MVNLVSVSVLLDLEAERGHDALEASVPGDDPEGLQLVERCADGRRAATREIGEPLEAGEQAVEFARQIVLSAPAQQAPV
jgi:hypothetical protein